MRYAWTEKFQLSGSTVHAHIYSKNVAVLLLCKCPIVFVNASVNKNICVIFLGICFLNGR